MIASKTAGFSGFDTCPGTFGKSPSGCAMRAEHLDVPKAIGSQSAGHGREFAHAVQRRIDDLQIARAGEALAGDSFG